MGVLDIPTHRRLIREAIAHEHSHVHEDYHSDEPVEDYSAANARPQRQRTPKLGRKCYGSLEVKRGNGVRRQRRNDNLFFLYSLVDGVNLEELCDEEDVKMTAFGELFVDPTKMKAWAEFIGMTEEEQLTFLQGSCRTGNNMAVDNSSPKDNEYKNDVLENQNFMKINKNIQDFLRSKDLAEDSLAEFEEDLITSFGECPIDVLVLNVPSSFDRMIIHGLCQYMKLQASTHKFKKKRLMEIESRESFFSSPATLLSSYLRTFKN